MADHQENYVASRHIKEEYKDFDTDFEMECSDEEMMPKDGVEWTPSPEEIIELFEKIDKGKVLVLEWTSPGRRPPTPVAKFDCQEEEENVKDNIPEVKFDFDFQDEMYRAGKPIRPVGSKRKHGPRGSAKKKTSSLDAILLNMARHRKLDMMEDDEKALTYLEA